ncbi:hypothetical protein AC578_1942 [Pseudocercospora eumusae]|uniref:Uncharacterized protein n=1 Tax=Pseudocercospora eumusae TaxID=321146 RepID=A0A139HDD5_9PEZI|nr:hypothetical protein AC578_1942 [Pseudocercospora eumusae]
MMGVDITIVELPDWLDLDLDVEADEEEKEEPSTEKDRNNVPKQPVSNTQTTTRPPIHPHAPPSEPQRHLQTARLQPPGLPAYPAAPQMPYPPPYSAAYPPNSLNAQYLQYGPPVIYQNPTLHAHRVPAALPPLGHGQVNYVPVAPPSQRHGRYSAPIECLRSNFIADPSGFVNQVALWEAFRREHGYPKTPFNIGATELIPQAFTAVVVLADRLPDGTYIIRGIKTNLRRNPGGLESMVPPLRVRAPHPQHYWWWCWCY